MDQDMNPFTRLGREVARAQDEALEAGDGLQEARARLLAGPQHPAARRAVLLLWLGITLAGALAAVGAGLIFFRVMVGVQQSVVEVFMNAVLIAVMAVIVASLVLEKDPAGGIRLTRTFSLLQEFSIFIRERKVWWMTPIMVVMAVLGSFIVMTEKSIILPFIYAVF